MTEVAESPQLGRGWSAFARRARAWCASARGGLALVLLSLAVYLPGVASLPPIDRDESRFAQASRQMLASGDVVVPRVQEKPRLNKPPLIYWLQAGAAWAATGGAWGDADPSRDEMWMYRVPSIVAAVLAVLATWRLGLAMFDPRVAWWAALCLAYCPIVYWEARQARADEVLLAATVWALHFQWRIAADVRRGPGRARGGGAADVLGLWACVAIGTLAKGPITPMVVLFGAIARCVADRSARPLTQIRPIAGLLLVAAAFAPWVVAVGERVGWSNYLTLVRAETLGRAAEAKEGHAGWPLYHLTLLPVVLFPGSLLLGLGLARAVARRARPAERFLLAAIVPCWIVFEVTSTKLPHYTMPLLPAVALLAARAIWSREVRGWLRRGVVRAAVWAWIVGVGVFTLTAGGLLAWVAWSNGAALAAVAAGAIGIALWLGPLVVIRRAWRRRDLLGMLRASLVVFGVGATMVGVAFPRLPAWLTRDVVRELAHIDPSWSTPIADVHLREDSVIVGTHGLARHVEEEDFDDWADAHPGGLVLLDAEYADVWARVEPVTTVSGVNYSIGRRMSVVIGRVRPSKGAGR